MSAALDLEKKEASVSEATRLSGGVQTLTSTGYLASCSLCSLICIILLSANTNFLSSGIILGLVALLALAGFIVTRETYSGGGSRKANHYEDKASDEVTGTTMEPKMCQKNGCRSGPIVPKSLLVSLLLLFLAFCTAIIVFLVALGQEWQVYQPDQAIAAVTSLLGLLVCLAIIHRIKKSWLNTDMENQMLGCCTCCCTFCGLPTLFICTFVVLWSNAADTHTMAIQPVGKLVPTTEGPTLHLYCTSPRGGHNVTLPSIIFLHGYGGSSLDAEGVRSDPRIEARGAKFCSIDRPGYGFSEGYMMEDPEKRHFGRISSLTLEVLEKGGVTGDLVLVFHSLGGYHALSLAGAISKRDDSLFRVRGMVAVDAMVPEWYEYNRRRESAYCSETSELLPNGWFWPLVRVATPSGLPRIVYATGFGGFADSVNLYPEKYRDNILNLNMRRKYIDSRITEGERWAINCGYALQGQHVLQNASDYVRLEVLVAIHGINITHFSEISSNETEINVELIDLTGDYPSQVSQHEALMLGEKAAREHVVPSLLRVLQSIIRRDYGE